MLGPGRMRAMRIGLVEWRDVEVCAGIQKDARMCGHVEEWGGLH